GAASGSGGQARMFESFRKAHVELIGGNDSYNGCSTCTRSKFDVSLGCLKTGLSNMTPQIGPCRIAVYCDDDGIDVVGTDAAVSQHRPSIEHMKLPGAVTGFRLDDLRPPRIPSRQL